MGAVPQAGDRYQVIIGGAVATVYNEIMSLPSMKKGGGAKLTDEEIKAAARSKTRGKRAWVDNFFEYLSDSFRPLLGVLLGASLLIAIVAVLDALNLVEFQNPGPEGLTPSLIFWNTMWRSVLFFIPVMVAYNAAKKLNVDPWLGFAVMAALFTPEYMSLRENPAANCVEDVTLGTQTCTIDIFGLPMTLVDYGGNVFVPLLMVPVLALVYHFLRRIVPENVQMVFVPFVSMLVMIPFTAFVIGPIGFMLGNELGQALAWLNDNAPIFFAVLIPLLYPFLVPLGLHWPLNALMLQNIATLGYDFIQGPMGAWNFACFGATAGVLVLTYRQRDKQLRQVATGALAAGLFGGISEPSLYGIHLRYKKIYPRMLLGCLVGGLIIGFGGGVKTSAFAFTSLLTIPVFDPIVLYSIAIAAAFFTAMFMVITFGFRTKEEVAEALAEQEIEHEALEAEKAHGLEQMDHHAEAAAGGGGAAMAATALLTDVKTTTVGAPVTGQVVAIDQVNDPAFSSKALGEGVGIIPEIGDIVAPVSGTVVSSMPHAFGIATDDGVEVLVHIGIDTVNLSGQHFSPTASEGQRVRAGDVMNIVDFDGIKAAGYDTTTMLTVTNTMLLSSVTARPPAKVNAGDAVLDVEK
jgi:PTS system beta-glucosides-specific IIC component